MKFINLGTRNKGTFWEYASAWTFSQTTLPNTSYYIPSFFSFGQGDSNAHCHDISLIQATKKVHLTELSQGKYTPKFFNALAKIYLDEYKRVKKIFSSSYTNDDSKDLAQKLEKMVFAFASTHTPMLFALKALYLDDEFSRILKSTLSKEELHEFEQIKAMLLTRPHLSFAQEEEAGINSLITTFNKKPAKQGVKEFLQKPTSQKRLESLEAKFGWFHREYMAKPYTQSDYARIIENRISEKAIAVDFKKELNKTSTKQKLFFKNHKSTELERFVNFMHGCAYILDHSKVIAIKIIHESEGLFNEIAQRIGTSRTNMLYLTLPEVQKLLIDGKLANSELIESRKKSRAVLLRDGNISVYDGETAKKMAEKYLEPETSANITQVKGIIAFPGTVRGRATIITSITQKEKFKNADILVTKDGPAELTYFLKKAAGIVTDQGGIISHVAIVARELKTPCVVATKNATNVFKDGDIIEIIEGGIVRKVKD